MQTLANHRRFYPPFHFFLVPVLVANLVIAGRAAFAAPSFATAWGGLMAFALLLGFGLARRGAIVVQDRLIRLEERLRLARLLPVELAARVDALTVRQLVGLRFASDEEVPELARRALAGELRDDEAIKRAIRTWRPDELRV